MNAGEYIRIRVATNIANGLKGSLLLGHLRRDIVLKRLIEEDGEDEITIKLLTSKLRDGVAHFTLFAPNGEPVSERLIFVENPENDLKLSLNTDKPNYGLREKVDVSLALSDAKGMPLEGDFSISVVTEKGLKKGPENIKSWLLLNSDLGGTVADPNYFFDETVKGRRYLLDLLMLTHGWRRFTWQSLTEDGVSKALAFSPEKGILIRGRTTAFENAYQPKKARTTLSIMAQEVLQEENATNAQGKFAFGPYFFQDSVETVINAESITDGQRNKTELAIYVDPPFPDVKIKRRTRRSVDRVGIVTYAEPYLEEAELKKRTDFKYDPKVTRLREVVVQSRPKTRKAIVNEKLSKMTLYGDAHTRIVLDSLPWLQPGSNGVMEILRTAPGVRINGSFPQQSVQIRNSANFDGAVPPLYLIDGIPITLDTGLAEREGGAIDYVPMHIQTLPIDDILFIDVLKGPEAATYVIRL